MITAGVTFVVTYGGMNLIKSRYGQRTAVVVALALAALLFALALR